MDLFNQKRFIFSVNFQYLNRFKHEQHFICGPFVEWVINNLLEMEGRAKNLNGQRYKLITSTKALQSN